MEMLGRPTPVKFSTAIGHYGHSKLYDMYTNL
jgi:hypothetical protein